MPFQLHRILRCHSEFHGCCVVELYDVPLRIERHDHVDGAFDDGAVETFSPHQLFLRFAVLIDFLFEQGVGLLCRGSPHLLPHQLHARGQVIDCYLHRWLVIKEAQDHLNTNFPRLAIGLQNGYLQVSRLLTR